MLPNNLCSNGKTLCYAHINQIYTLDDSNRLTTGTATVLRSVYAENEAVCQVQYAPLADQEYLVVGTQYGLLNIYDETGMRLVHSHRIFEGPTLVRGIAHDGAQRLFVGTSRNNVHVFQVSQHSFSQLQLLSDNKAPVTAVAANKQVLAVGDEDGTVLLYALDSLLLQHTFTNPDDAVSSIAFSNNFLLVAFFSGRVRIYDTVAKSIVAEIQAHARPIFALDVFQEKGLFALGSEDTFVSVWTLPDPAGKVSCLHCSDIKHSLICGIKFARNTDQLTLLATSYDWTHLNVLTLA